MKGSVMRFLTILAVLTFVFLFPMTVLAQEADALEVESSEVEVISNEQAYVSYLAAPAAEGTYPAIVLIHSFNGLEEGYRTMTDRLAAEGFVVLAVGWQTFERSPSDD